ncbi:contractile injection system protein, VgrG/Pvc8 family [Roseateles sp.]|uniref:contractile injection system protein, VgrG/Pvc8 family n=1 Tax=Roseateles sp. TaxID=1971397 RepID=UPI003265BB0D
MPTATLRLFLDDMPADEEQLAAFGAIRVDQAIGMAAEAELDVPVGTNEQGAWEKLEDDFAQAFARIRVEIKVGDGQWIALIDGPVVGQRFTLDATPETSLMTLVVHDDSVLLDRDEDVKSFEDQTVSDIASALYSEAGLTPQVDTLADAGSALSRFRVHRGTPMQLLRKLAREHGMFAYVEPGPAPGASVGVFQRMQAADDSLPELVLLGDARNIGRFSAHFDALRPLAPQAFSVLAADKQVVTSQAEQSTAAALGDEAVHTLLTPARTLLTSTREEQGDIDAAVQAGADLSSWAYGAQGEVQADSYAGVLRPYRKLSVSGAGGHLSGDYLISRVSHEIRDSGYKQQFSLTRNARSAGSGVSGGVSGGLSGGLF